MQLYRGMDVGTAKLAPAERRGIPHHLLDVLDVTETATVAPYQRAAGADVEAIAARGAVPIIVGGSMLYIQSVLDDWASRAPIRWCGPGGRPGWPRSARRRCTRNWRAATRTPPPRSCLATAAGSCARWRWWS